MGEFSEVSLDGMRGRLLVAICSGLLCFGQAPSFRAERILAGDRSIPLAPGLILSIYGEHLGPATACEGHADQQMRETPSLLRPRQNYLDTLVYPKQLCDTQVLVGGMPAGLLYVSRRQINFKVPQEIGIEGNTTVQVIFKGQASLAVPMALGLKSVVLSLESATRVGQPVWLKVSPPSGRGDVRYPFQIWPASFGCHLVEVRTNGKLLVPFASLETQATHGVILSGSPCGSVGFSSEARHTGRIPLHLRYRFEQAGVYEVRYSFRNDFPRTAEPLFISEWTPIEILPGTSGERARWLTEISRHAPTDTVELLTDYLPSILGIPDQQSLLLLSECLYYPDQLVRQFAEYGLTYWPSDAAKVFVRQLLRNRGPSDVVVQFLSGDGDSLVKTAIPYLMSSSPVLVRGAVHAISREGIKLSPALRTAAASTLISAAENVISVADNQTKTEYAAALGTVHDARAAALLWSLVNRNIGRGQALIALTWLHAPEDLERLANLTLAPADGNNPGYDLASLPYALHRGYGDAALPYIRMMSQKSEFAAVRTSAARELKEAEHQQ